MTDDSTYAEAVYADLNVRFTYHAPHTDQPDRYDQIRSAALHMATLIVDITPWSREQSLALTNLEQAVMWANAAIARRDPPPVP